MKQYVRLFSAYVISIDTDINDFLKKHPEYSIDKIAFASGNSDRALVVFNVKEPPTYSVAHGVHASDQNTSNCKENK